MGINLDKMRAKLNAVQNRGGGSKKSAFWRPEDGEQTIRILPTADGDPFKEFFFHYNLGKNAGFLSPKKKPQWLRVLAQKRLLCPDVVKSELKPKKLLLTTTVKNFKNVWLS